MASFSRGCVGLLLCLVFGVLGDDVNMDDLPDVVDLTWEMKGDEILYWPGYPMGFNMTNVWRDNTTFSFGNWVEANQFKMVIHVGTHMDAPCHFCKESKCWRMHEIPFDHLRGPAAVFDIKEKAKENPNYELTVEDIEEWEEKNGKLPKGAFIMVTAGIEDKWPSREKTFGPNYAKGEFRWPGLSQEAVKHIVDNTDVKGIGGDWFGAESGGSFMTNDSDYYAHGHRRLLGDNRLLLEYVNNIDKLPPTGYTVYVNPLKIHDSCGSPCRMIAIKNPPSAAARPAASPVMLTIAVAMLAAVLEHW